jgi:hypothetical protein
MQLPASIQNYEDFWVTTIISLTAVNNSYVAHFPPNPLDKAIMT